MTLPRSVLLSAGPTGQSHRKSASAQNSARIDGSARSTVGAAFHSIARGQKGAQAAAPSSKLPVPSVLSGGGPRNVNFATKSHRNQIGGGIQGDRIQAWVDFVLRNSIGYNTDARVAVQVNGASLSTSHAWCQSRRYQETHS